MTQKMKAASLTADLLVPKSAAKLTPDLVAPKGAATDQKKPKQATDLSSTPIPAVAVAAPTAVGPAQNNGGGDRQQPAAAKPPTAKADGDGGLQEPAAANVPDAQTDADTDTPKPGRADPSQTLRNGVSGAEASAPAAVPSDRTARSLGVQIPLWLNPAAHLELIRAAARSGMSCQELIIEALAMYFTASARDKSEPPRPGGSD